MKLIFPLFLFLLFSCKNERVSKSDIVFEIQNKELFRANILKIKITNKSNTDYFFCFDTTSTYFNLGLDYEINEFIHPRPIFYFNDDIISLILHTLRVV